MKGTEKQIKWAEDIITSAQETIRRNIERNANDEKELRIWKWMEAEYAKAMEQVGDNAALIINNRKALDSDRVIYLTNQARMGFIEI